LKGNFDSLEHGCGEPRRAFPERLEAIHDAADRNDHLSSRRHGLTRFASELVGLADPLPEIRDQFRDLIRRLLDAAHGADRGNGDHDHGQAGNDNANLYEQ
jgi:hypothetical protein